MMTPDQNHDPKNDLKPDIPHDITRLHGKGITRGKATAEVLLSPQPFRFLGDVDMDTSCIVAQGHPLKGEKISGKVLVFPHSRGSGSANVILQVLAENNLAPKAIINLEMADTNLAEGVILCQIPLVCRLNKEDYQQLKTGLRVTVDAKDGTVSLKKTRLTDLRSNR